MANPINETLNVYQALTNERLSNTNLSEKQI